MWSVTCKNDDNSASLYFLIMPPALYFLFILAYISVTIKYFNENL